MGAWLTRTLRRLKVARAALTLFKTVEEQAGDTVTVSIHTADAYLFDNVRISG